MDQRKKKSMFFYVWGKKATTPFTIQERKSTKKMGGLTKSIWEEQFCKKAYFLRCGGTFFKVHS